RQYRELQRLLQEELGEPPSEATQRLAAEIRRSGEQAAMQEAFPGSRGAAPAAARLSPPMPGSPAEPPSGTLTFLLADIEGFHPSAEPADRADGAARADLWDVLRGEFRRHGGFEARPDAHRAPGESDDSFLVAFWRAGDALACSVAVQRAVAARTEAAAGSA